MGTNVRNRVVAILGSAGAALVLSSGLAAQQYRDWYVCGGNNFRTCAAVTVSLTANSSGTTDVTMRVWNLARDGTAGSVFTWIGFHGTGVSGVTAASSQVSMLASSAGTQASPSAWVAGAAPSQAGGVALQMAGSANDGTSSVSNSIASTCDMSANPGGLSGKKPLWLNPCWDGQIASLYDQSSYVTLQFQVNGAWDLAGTELTIQVQNGPNGDSSQCITGPGGNCAVVPEPVTTVLFGSGLLALGAANLRRRRRNGLPE